MVFGFVPYWTCACALDLDLDLKLGLCVLWNIFKHKQVLASPGLSSMYY
jgi:hypothetical protein